MGLVGGKVGVGDALDGQHLQPAAVLEESDVERIALGEVAVEPGREAEIVLGQVHDAVAGIERRRLVGEAAGIGDRLAIRLAVGRHLEDEAVPLRQRDVRHTGEIGADVGAVDRLLAGDPASPRHPPTAAVHLRAVEAGEAAHDLAEQRHLVVVVPPPARLS